MACNQNSAGVQPKKLVAPTSVGATSLNAVAQGFEPWEYSPEQLRGISDLVHAMHAATGAEVPCNEEWYYRPPSSSIPMRMRILIKWRISTIAGFEGGTRIYLNTIDPWSVHQRMLERLVVMRDECSIAQMKLGEECKVTPLLLR